MGNTPVNIRVQKYRKALRMAGLRPMQIWVPDTRCSGFAEECQRQCQLVTQADGTDESMQQLMSNVLEDLEDWTA